MERIHCVRHQESTPSLVVYDTHAYCYGGCGRIELSELGRVAETAPKERYKEDLDARRKEIEKLPTNTYRGFSFHCDDRGVYICWPDCSYFKHRLFNPAPGQSKYKCPAGQPQPPFWARRGTSRTLVLSEGEINALSIAEAFPEYDVLSPGSASDFKTAKFTKYLLTLVRYYCTVIIVADYDGAGTDAAIHTKGLLLNKAPNIHIVLMKRDANEILTNDGKEKLREEVQGHLPKL